MLRLGPAQGNEAFGLINRRGYLAINRAWEWVDYAYEERIRAVEDGMTGFAGLDGKWVIQPKYVFADRFQEGFAIVGDGSKFGIINLRGDTLVPLRLDGALRFQEGLAAVQVGERVGFIDVAGKVRVKPELLWARSFHSGLAAFKAEDPKQAGQEVIGYLNKKGKVAWQDSSGQVQELGDFNGGLAAVRIGDRWGYLSERFRVQIQPRFEAVRDFTNGLAAVKESGKWGYIDKRGQWVIEPQFDDADDFDSRLAMAKTEAGWGYIDKRGDWAIKPQFTYAEPYFRGYARVSASPNFGYIDSAGGVMWDPGQAGVKPGPSALNQRPWLSTQQVGLDIADRSPIGPYPAEHQYQEHLPRNAQESYRH